MRRLDGVSLLEVLVVLAILSLATFAAFGLMRRAPAVAPTAFDQAEARITAQRLQARRASVPRVIAGRVLGGEAGCGTGQVTFFADGSVRADDGLCLVVDGQETPFRIDPLNGTLEVLE